MSITPLIIGTGRAGQAIAKSFSVLGLQHPELKLASAVFLKRGTKLASVRKDYDRAVLCIANPHGLHANAILEADQAGFDAILCEKPSCINLQQLNRLQEVRTPTAILHIYRQTWGLQTLKAMFDDGSLGQLISVEGRYWQASTAERALLSSDARTDNWKNDATLSGDSDVYLDLGTHWVDAVSFLYGEPPSRVQGWKTFINAEAPHRDSHVQIALDYPSGGRALGSISKTVHGATNQFEIHVIGAKKSASWAFLNPDEIMIGEGRDRRILTRKHSELGSLQSPYHGMGWLEGYIEITRRLLGNTFLAEDCSYPDLQTNLKVMESVFRTSWQS